MAGSKEIELGSVFQPKFDKDGLLPAVAQDAVSGEVLMVAYMNDEALRKTLEIGEAVYYSRSRSKLWHKGESSGMVQKVKQILVDCDQDCLILKVENVGGASCHNGFRTCFYREVSKGSQGPELQRTDCPKLFDPEKVYGKS
ncbi:MAG: phosphoribosyl-AMP cyclohydrolase [Planctomycetes bacterium]|nr:phosphoribosyl-AMP cyclohydrolase [Planctomycetota bacterium]